MSTYYSRHKEDRKAKVQAYKDTLKDNFFTIYYLPEEHYVGITNQPIIRMRNQRWNGKITTDWEVVTIVETRTEALKIESFMHSLGYIGACEWNTNSKKYL